MTARSHTRIDSIIENKNQTQTKTNPSCLIHFILCINRYCYHSYRFNDNVAVTL